MALSQKDLEKLVNSGFTIIRTQDVSSGMDPMYLIKKRSTYHTWITMCQFLSKKDRDLRVKELLLNKKIIYDGILTAQEN